MGTVGDWLLVAAGAAVGAPLRYLTDRAVQARHASPLPWGTVTVNAVACLLMGLLMGASVPPAAYSLLGTGLCGALSTYSAFSYETLRLVERGRAGLAAAHVGVSAGVGIGALAAGVVLGRAFAG
ncbi:CrcB family protein [Streptomyces yaizuensis]|uniref:Fluoride-specific ion channel FluC n=1 Tax=Streptomyces yaizuensis TaxID=2989713 RepID=A0ABQ5P1N6_9ACTN|nr:CrcB family protein [Streptomyces sp. YSPA8]